MPRKYKIPKKGGGLVEDVTSAVTQNPLVQSVSSGISQGVQKVQEATGMKSAADTMNDVADVNTADVSDSLGVKKEEPGMTTTGGRRRKTVKKGKKSKKTLRRRR